MLGGPIVKDRIFFFGAYQGTRATQTPADIVTFIPTAAMLAGDFSTVASAQCRAQRNLTLPAILGFANNRRYVVSAFRRTVTVRLKPDTTYDVKASVRRD